MKRKQERVALHAASAATGHPSWEAATEWHGWWCSRIECGEEAAGWREADTAANVTLTAK